MQKDQNFKPIKLTDPDLKKNVGLQLQRLRDFRVPAEKRKVETESGRKTIIETTLNPEPRALRSWAEIFADMSVGQILEEYRLLIAKQSRRSSRERRFLKQMFEEAIVKTQRERIAAGSTEEE